MQPPQQSSQHAFFREIPHLIVVALLLFCFLIVLTKFHWIHCSQIPGWCDVYCNIFGNSRVGVIYGNSGAGIGDPNLLKQQIDIARQFTFVDPPIPMEEASYGFMKNYELIIVEKAKDITPRQADAIKNYLVGGGNLIWIGDAGTKYSLLPDEEQEALFRNQSDPGYYERVKKALNSSVGFGTLSDVFFVKFVRNEPARGGLTLQKVSSDHYILKGLIANISMPSVPYTVVTANPTGAQPLAFIKTANGTIPGIVESRYGGKVLYVAFPIEQLAKTGARALLINMVDYLVTC